LLRLFVLSLMAVMLTGCAALDLKRPVAELDRVRIQRVAAVSFLGETFHGVSIGTTVFQNKRFSATVPEWKVDAFASERVAKLVQNAKLEASVLDRAGLPGQRPLEDKEGRIWDSAKRQGFDTLVVLYPAINREAFPFFEPALGFYERTSMLRAETRCVYAAFIVNVYDVATRKSIGWEWGGGGPCAPGSDNDIPYMTAFQDYSLDQRSVLRDRLLTRIDRAIAYALDKLALVPLSSMPR
jgi:hypothetical protein